MDTKESSELIRKFENCDFSNRKCIEEKLTICILQYIRQKLTTNLSKTEEEKLAKELAEAILEDIEVREYSLKLWKENMLPNEKNEKCDVNEIKELICRINGDKKKYFVLEYNNKYYNGIIDYAVRYSQSDSKKIENGIMQGKSFLDATVGNELYKKIYPVFWMALLNKKHKKSTDNKKSLIDPIYKGTEKEQHLFALLADNSNENIKKGTIFSGIQKQYRDRMRKKNIDVPKYDMQNASERLCFVREMKKNLFNEKTSGNRNKIALINNLATIREMLEIGEIDNIDIPAFMFWLDKMTGWIEFYNFVSLNEGSNGEYRFLESDSKEIVDIQERIKEYNKEIDELIEKMHKCTEKKYLFDLIQEAAEAIERKESLEYKLSFNENIYVDNAAFQYLKKFNHIGVLYVLGKYIKNYQNLKEVYQSILGKEICRKIAELYKLVSDKKQYEQKEWKVIKSKCYRQLFDELFVNDFSKVNKTTKIDVLNFYDAYITYMQ